MHVHQCGWGGGCIEAFAHSSVGVGGGAPLSVYVYVCVYFCVIAHPTLQ